MQDQNLLKSVKKPVSPQQDSPVYLDDEFQEQVDNAANLKWKPLGGGLWNRKETNKKRKKSLELFGIENQKQDR